MSRLHAGVHIRKLELRVLHLGQALAKLLALLNVLDGFLHRALADAERLGSDADAAAVKRLHCDSKALALFAEQVLFGNDAVFHDKLAGRAAADAHLLFLLANGEAREVLFNDERRNALVARLLVGHGEDDVHMRIARIGNEDLGAVEHIMIVNQFCGRLLAGSIRARVGLGEAERADPFAGKELRQVLHLLLFGAVLIDRRAAERSVRGDDNARGRAGLGKLFDRHSVCEHIAARSAILLRERNAHETVARKLLNGFHREAFFLVNLLSEGFDLVLRECTIHVAEQQMLFGKREIHSSS